MMDMTAVLVIDDHQLVASGTKSVLIKAGFDCDTLASARSVVSYMDRKHYDLYLVDLNMPDIDGMEAAERILDTDADAKVIIYTGYETEIEPLFGTMLDKGISGVISKSASIESLVASLKAALRDEVLVPMWLFRKLRVGNREENGSGPAPDPRFNQIESQIMLGVIQGETNREIAKRLLVGQRTVEKYLTGIFQKLGVHSRIEAANKMKAKGYLLNAYKKTKRRF
ncbi:response regulator transcription factor [Sporolactobacillus sp. THM7-7]|nr:response regulator transcription factor [Sporolactobacillus sp. THM7-7]